MIEKTFNASIFWTIMQRYNGAKMTELEQIITCPNCHGGGWVGTFTNSPRSQCPVCEARGLLVIDSDKTMALPMRAKPLNQQEMKVTK